MDNIHEVGVKPYRAATEQQPPFTLAEIVHTALCLLRKVIKYQCLSFLLWLQIIWQLLIPQKPKSVKGQTALVTGGANGLGRALCIRLAQEGCNVAVVDVDNVNIKRTVADLQAFKVEAKGYKV
jgi:all-trans-retinol dehydrogenase (NAD+)